MLRLKLTRLIKLMFKTQIFHFIVLFFLVFFSNFFFPSLLISFLELFRAFPVKYVIFNTFSISVLCFRFAFIDHFNYSVILILILIFVPSRNNFLFFMVIVS